MNGPQPIPFTDIKSYLDFLNLPNYKKSKIINNIKFLDSIYLDQVYKDLSRKTK